MKLLIVPMELRDANTFVESQHRHHKRVQGHRFSLGCECDGELCGVAIIGRPVSRLMQDGYTVEITRVCTDGTKNACSKLLGAACRAAFAIGYKRVLTYTLATECGSSLLAAGFSKAGKTKAQHWSRPSRERDLLDGNGKMKYPIIEKIRWERIQ